MIRNSNLTIFNQTWDLTAPVPVDWTCFEKDAPIETKQGTKPIQDIKIGDIVQTWNENTERFEWKKVLNIFERVAESTLHIRLSNGQVMKVTPEHKILVNGVWNEAKSIKTGDKLLSFTGEDLRVLSIERINKEVTVYNFETEDNHTYIAYGVVVHNRCALNGPVKVGNKTYQITNGEDVYDSSGRKLTAIEVYDIINRPVFDFANPSQDDISSLASTLSRDEVFQILVHYQNDALQLDPSGMQRQSLVRIIAADVQYTHAPLTIQQQNIIRQVGQSADIAYLTTGLITVAAPPVSRTSHSGRALIEEGKINNYLFGRASGNRHNIDRAAQNAIEMKRLGIPDNTLGYSIIESHLQSAAQSTTNVSRSFSNQYGTFEVRESFLIGPSGRAAKLESTWQVMPDRTRRLITVIPYGGRR